MRKQNNVYNNWECKCGESFKTRRDLYNHRKVCKKIKLGEQPIHLYTCDFCKKSWETTASGFGTHKRMCLENPERIPNHWKGKKHSEEAKKKISEGTKKAHDEGRGHTWKNRYLNPSYAEQWLYGLLDNNHIEYEKEKPFFGFFLDIAIGNKCIEIDGEQHGEDTRFPEQIERDERKDKLLLENGWKELRIKWSDVKKMPDYFAEKIIEFIKTGETVFDGEFATRKQKEIEKKEAEALRRETLTKNGQVGKNGRLYSKMITEAEWQERKQKILNSGISLDKFGCINKISEVTGLSRRVIANTLRRYSIEWKTHNYK